MSEQKGHKLKWLQKHLPEGLIVDARWLSKHGYSTALRSQYVASKWLEQPTRQVYRRPQGQLSWQQVIISLQTLLARNPLTVGGRTALELQGYAHYLSHAQLEVHLYSPAALPAWLDKLRLGVRFIYHNSERLFGSPALLAGTASLNFDIAKSKVTEDFVAQPWGQWNWPLTLSTPERAVFELLNELPEKESFHQVDDLFQGLTNLRPDRLQKLLRNCKSVKVKRLFFFFADRHKHAWLKRLNQNAVDLGKGDRSLVKGGKYDRKYQITVPEDLNGVQ